MGIKSSQAPYYETRSGLTEHCIHGALLALALAFVAIFLVLPLATVFAEAFAHEEIEERPACIWRIAEPPGQGRFFCELTSFEYVAKRNGILAELD